MKKTKGSGAGAGVASAGLVYGLRRGWGAALERIWQSLFGPPDLGPVDFRALIRRKTPNDALACPPDFCPEARPDFETPVFPVPAERLRAILAEVATQEPDTVLLDSGPEQDRYLVRTRLMRFPDTVVAQAVTWGGDHSTLALYSRSQVGRSDLGVNKRRLERWVERISRLVATERRDRSC